MSSDLFSSLDLSLVYRLIPENRWQAGIFAFALAAATTAVYRRVTDPLRHIPAPFWWEYKIIHKLAAAIYGTEYKHIQRLHRKYGTIVRISVNTIAIADPNAYQAVYGNHKFTKGPFYGFIQQSISGENIFTTRDRQFHK